MSSRFTMSTSVTLVTSYFTGASVENIANGIIAANGKLIAKVESSPLKSSENHYTSECEFLTVYFVGEDKPLEYFVKKIPTDNSRVSNIIKDTGLFQKEAKFFTALLRDVDQFCGLRFSAAGTTRFKKTKDFFPTVVYASDSCLCSENLRVTKYVPCKCPEGQQDLQHARIVLSKWAKFQARTFAMIKEAGAEAFSLKYDLLDEVYFVANNESKFGQDSLVGFITPVINAVVKLLKRDGNSQHRMLFQRVAQYENCSFSKICHILEGTTKFPVVNHGDLWNNNMYFSYDDKGLPQTVKFFDLQVTRINSPAVDISYYFNSLDPSVRKQNWKKLLKFYYQEFRKETMLLGFNFGLSFYDFMDDFRKKAVVGFIFGLCGIVFWSPILKYAADGKCTDCKDNGDACSPTLFTDVAMAAAEWMNQNEVKASELLREKILDFLQEYDRMGVLF